MTKLEQRLRDDASGIEVRVTSGLRVRIAGALRRARHAARPDPGVSFPLWLAGSLTGVAGAALLIVLLQRVDTDAEQAEAAVARTVPEYVRRFEHTVPLYAETADLTEPLEEELENLRADIEKARRNVERDLDFTF